MPYRPCHTNVLRALECGLAGLHDVGDQRAAPRVLLFHRIYRDEVRAKRVLRDIHPHVASMLTRRGEEVRVVLADVLEVSLGYGVRGDGGRYELRRHEGGFEVSRLQM